MNDKKNREPMVIALATGKGGSMKTTSAVFLACALVDQSRGEQRVLVADADVQGDAKDWWYRAAELDDPLPFDVMSAAPADIAHLHGINGRLDDPVDWVLIDSAPYGRALDESVNNADLVVIPSSPSRIDLDQAAGVKDLCEPGAASPPRSSCAAPRPTRPPCATPWHGSTMRASRASRR